MRISDWSSDVCSSDLLGAALDSGASAISQPLRIAPERPVILTATPAESAPAAAMVDPQTGLGTQVGQYALDVHGGHGTSGVYAYSNADIAETRSRLLAPARGLSGIGRTQTPFDGQLRPIKDPRERKSVVSGKRGAGRVARGG